MDTPPPQLSGDRTVKRVLATEQAVCILHLCRTFFFINWELFRTTYVVDRQCLVIFLEGRGDSVHTRESCTDTVQGNYLALW